MDRADYETLPMIQHPAEQVNDSSVDLGDDENDIKDGTLYQAVRDGDLEALRRLLSDRSVMQRVNDPDENGMTALHYAARDKQLDAAKVLLDEGRAYAAVHGEDGLTPLHVCARKREKTKVKETIELIHLLAFLTDVNVRDRYKSTPLHFAAMRGNDIAAKALLQCDGVHVNAKDSLGYTPLHESAVYNDLDVALLLVEYGANIKAWDNNGRTALHLAAMGEENTKMIKLLIQNVSKDEVQDLINLKDKDHNTALHLAIDARNSPAIKLLLKYGANVNVTCRMSSTGSTPLHLAAITGDTRIMEMLLGQGAKLTSRDRQGCTALHKAVEYQNQDAVKFILSKLRVAPEHKDNDSYTPLLLSACYPDKEIFKFLLESGCNINALESQERNVLHLAASNDGPDILLEIMNVLDHLEDYSLMNDTDKNAESPLHIAARLGYVEIVKILIEGGADLTVKNDDEETPFLLAAKGGDVSIVDLFLQASSKVLNDQDEYSNAGLHLAAAGGHVTVVETLVRAGADKDIRNVRLDTPMDFACIYGHADVVDFLLDEDVSPNDTDDNMDTPLLLASREGHEDVISVLIERGADVKACDKRGRNCLSLAIDKGHRDAALAIVQSSKWRMAMLHELDHHGRIRDTPMRKLIRNMPDVAQVVLNRCITSSPETVHPSDKDYWYRFNFPFLDDTFIDYNPSTVKELSKTSEEEPTTIVEGADSYSWFPYTRNMAYLVDNHPLMLMVQHKRDDLLSHPLVLAMAKYKWNVARPTYFFYMIFYALFLIVLTAFLVTAKPPYKPEGQCPPNQTERGQHSVQGNFEEGSSYFILIFAVIGIVTEIVQMVMERKLYLMQPFNLLDWFTYISAILVVIDFTICGAKTPWQWQLGAFCLFATWINFLLLLRRVPGIGIYTVMIQDILKTFSKFALVFFLFLLAFTFTFYILLENQGTFDGPWKSIVKTWSMMLGEFSFDDIFFPDEEADKVTYEVVTYIIFVIFLVVMAIVLVNLMTGLAIDDVNELQSHAQLRKIAIQLELAITMEVSMPDKFRRGLAFSVEGIAMFPNRGSNRVMKFLSNIFDGPILNDEKIVERVRELEGERPSDVAQLEMKMDRYLAARKSEKSSIESRLVKIEKMLETLVAAKQNSGSKKKKKAATYTDDSQL